MLVGIGYKVPQNEHDLTEVPPYESPLAWLNKYCILGSPLLSLKHLNRRIGFRLQSPNVPNKYPQSPLGITTEGLPINYLLRSVY